MRLCSPRSPRVVILACLTAGACAAPADRVERATAALMNGLALTPPMGWNSWNRFGCNVSDQLVRAMADAMVTTGMRDAGYVYLNIDDCWQVARAADGTIQPDPARFPAKRGFSDRACPARCRRC